MGTDESYTCGEPTMTCGLVESLCCTPETSVTSCVNYTLIKKRYMQKHKTNIPTNMSARS